MSSEYGDFNLGTGPETSPTFDSQALAEMLRRKRMLDDAPQATDPYGAPQPTPPPHVVAGQAAGPADPYGAPQVQANDPGPVTDAEIRAALAELQKPEGPMPTAPFGYGRHGFFTGPATANYEAQMHERGQGRRDAQQRLKDLMEIRQHSEDANFKKQQGDYYSRRDQVDAALEVLRNPESSPQQVVAANRTIEAAQKARHAPASANQHAPSDWEILRDPNASQDEKDIAKRRLIHDWPENTPKPNWGVLEDDATDEQGNPVATPYRFDATTGRATTFDNKPYTPKGSPKKPGSNRPQKPGGMSDYQSAEIREKAVKNVTTRNMMTGDGHAPTDDEIQAEVSRLMPQSGQGGQGGGKVAPGKFTHISGSGKFGWDGAKWVPIQPQQ